MTHNLLYETKLTGKTKLLRSFYKIRSFFMGYCKNDMQYNVNARIILLHYIYVVFFNFHKLLLSTNEFF